MPTTPKKSPKAVISKKSVPTKKHTENANKTTANKGKKSPNKVVQKTTPLKDKKIATIAKKPHTKPEPTKPESTNKSTNSSPEKSSESTNKIGKRSKLKELIHDVLVAAGKSGERIVDIAEKTKRSVNGIYVFFATTAKNVPGLQKVGPGKWALAEIEK